MNCIYLNSSFDRATYTANGKKMRDESKTNHNEDDVTHPLSSKHDYYYKIDHHFAKSTSKLHNTIVNEDNMDDTKHSMSNDDIRDVILKTSSAPHYSPIHAVKDRFSDLLLALHLKTTTSVSSDEQECSILDRNESDPYVSPTRLGYMFAPKRVIRIDKCLISSPQLDNRGGSLPKSSSCHCTPATASREEQECNNVVTSRHHTPSRSSRRDEATLSRSSSDHDQGPSTPRRSPTRGGIRHQLKYSHSLSDIDYKNDHFPNATVRVCTSRCGSKSCEPKNSQSLSDLDCISDHIHKSSAYHRTQTHVFRANVTATGDGKHQQEFSDMNLDSYNRIPKTSSKRHLERDRGGLDESERSSLHLCIPESSSTRHPTPTRSCVKDTPKTSSLDRRNSYRHLPRSLSAREVTPTRGGRKDELRCCSDHLPKSFARRNTPSVSRRDELKNKHLPSDLLSNSDHVPKSSTVYHKRTDVGRDKQECSNVNIDSNNRTPTSTPRSGRKDELTSCSDHLCKSFARRCTPRVTRRYEQHVPSGLHSNSDHIPKSSTVYHTRTRVGQDQQECSNVNLDHKNITPTSTSRSGRKDELTCSSDHLPKSFARRCTPRVGQRDEPKPSDLHSNSDHVPKSSTVYHGQTRVGRNMNLDNNRLTPYPTPKNHGSSDVLNFSHSSLVLDNGDPYLPKSSSNRGICTTSRENSLRNINKALQKTHSLSDLYYKGDRFPNASITLCTSSDLKDSSDLLRNTSSMRFLTPTHGGRFEDANTSSSKEQQARKRNCRQGKITE